MKRETWAAVGLFTLASVIAAIAIREFVTGPFMNVGAFSMVATSIVLMVSGGTYVRS